MKLSFSTFVTVMVFSFTISAAERKPEPIGDPIPSKIEKGEIRVALENFVRFPKTAESASPVQTNSAYARIQYMTPLPDGSGRLVINDLRGVLYLTDEDGTEPAVYLDLRDEDVDFDDSRIVVGTMDGSIHFYNFLVDPVFHEDLFKLAEKYIRNIDKVDLVKYSFLLKLFDKAEIININEL